MGNINNTIISGNLTRDCTKKKAGETPLIEFSVAVNEFRKDKEPYTSFFDCVLFGKRAQGLADYMLKGQKVAVSGRLRQDRWQAEDGSNRSKVVLIVQEIEIVTPKKQDNEQDEIPW